MWLIPHCLRLIMFFRFKIFIWHTFNITIHFKKILKCVWGVQIFVIFQTSVSKKLIFQIFINSYRIWWIPIFLKNNCSMNKIVVKALLTFYWQVKIDGNYETQQVELKSAYTDTFCSSQLLHLSVLLTHHM